MRHSLCSLERQRHPIRLPLPESTHCIWILRSRSSRHAVAYSLSLMLAWSQHRAAFTQALPRLGPILLDMLSTAFSLPSAAACSAAVFLLRASTRTGADGSRSRQSSKSTPESDCAIEFLDHVSAVSEANGTTVPVSLDLGSSLSIQPSEGRPCLHRPESGDFGRCHAGVAM
jgi:hypothetical protein